MPVIDRRWTTRWASARAHTVVVALGFAHGKASFARIEFVEKTAFKFIEAGPDAFVTLCILVSGRVYRHHLVVGELAIVATGHKQYAAPFLEIAAVWECATGKVSAFPVNGRCVVQAEAHCRLFALVRTFDRRCVWRARPFVIEQEPSFGTGSFPPSCFRWERSRERSREVCAVGVGGCYARYAAAGRCRL